MSLTILNGFNLGKIQTQNVSAGASTYSSIYEAIDPLTTVTKQHFIEWFSGSVLDSIWTQSNASGTGTFAMSDEIDGGFSISTGATGGNNSYIQFSDKRQYDTASTSYTAVWKATALSGNVVYFGLLNNPLGGTGALYQEMNNDAYANFTAVSNSVQTSGTVAKDTNYHVFKCIGSSSNALFYIDGVLDVTGGATSSTKTQPVFRVRSTTNGAKTGQIRYCEAYNT